MRENKDLGVIMQNNVIYGINGPVVTVKGRTELSMSEMVYVGNLGLVGEVIRIDRDAAVIQVYEETSGLKPGEPVKSTGLPMSVLLGPGILSNIFDGIENPLEQVAENSGAFIPRGLRPSPLDENKLWEVTVTAQVGDELNSGDIYATCPETKTLIHKIMVPPDVSGRVVEVKPSGEYRINDTVVVIENELGEKKNLTLCHRWPIRTPRPIAQRLALLKPLVTGQRNIDTLFPIPKGGAAAVPGGFGAGKTVVQHQLAKWCDADMIIYIGCGERGNEMTQVLNEFKEIIDPKTGESLTNRTVLIANTSNMPVAAREASIYTGVTIAEYYRDMGYHAAMMADSTSRWAEALREISGRLEEMPADEGFPAYLPSRLSEFYERAGYVETLSGNEGSVSIIGAVSPQGADFSEPVTQNTKRFIRCFWALDKSLAYARHYPAINWNDSYSEYLGDLSPWYIENVGADFMTCRNEICTLLAEEKSLLEIVKLIGADVLPDDQKLIIEIARVIRVGFLQQDALSDIDTYVVSEKQLKMMRTILLLYRLSKELIAKQIQLSKITETGLFDKLIQMKNNIPNDKLEMFDEYDNEIKSVLALITE